MPKVPTSAREAGERETSNVKCEIQSTNVVSVIIEQFFQTNLHAYSMNPNPKSFAYVHCANEAL